MLMDSVFDIFLIPTEILGLILIYQKCALVCKKWCLIWRSTIKSINDVRFLELHPNPKFITKVVCKGDSETLFCPKRFMQLTSLKLYSDLSTTTNPNSELTILTNLTKLSVNQFYSPRNFVLTNLKSLSVINNSSFNSCITNLTNLTSLRNHNHYYRCTTHLINLRKMELMCRHDAASILTNLTVLNYTGTLRDESIIKLTNLTSINIMTNDITNQSISLLTNLTRIDLYAHRAITSAIFVSLTKIKNLNISSNTTIDFVPTTLRSLTIDNGIIVSADNLRLLTNLEILKIYDNANGDENIIFDDILRSMTNLIKLSLPKKDFVFTTIRNLNNLQKLVVEEIDDDHRNYFEKNGIKIRIKNLTDEFW